MCELHIHVFCVHLLDESDGLGFEDDENDSDYEAPDEKYCICKQPYGKR